jgi:hypothetical protein
MKDSDYCSRECEQASADYHYEKMIRDDKDFEREATARLIAVGGLPTRDDA